MIKKNLIPTAIYAALTVLITLTMLEEASFIFILIALNISFGIFILFTFYQNFRSAKRNSILNNQNVPDERSTIERIRNFDGKDVLKISQRPFLFGLENRWISDHEFYFDQNFFYAADKAGTALKYPLTDITELSGTGTVINNNRIWKITLGTGSESCEYHFAHNFSIWNRNFQNFYTTVKRIRPEAIKSEWSLWRM